MSYEAKFGFTSGYSLVFSAFQPSGVGRGLEQQPLPEIWPKGYYVATPITDLVVGDMVLAYELENVTWEDDLVYILAEALIYYEGDRVHWEGEWIFYSGEEASEGVTSLGDVVGSGEYESVIESSADLTEIEAKIDIIDTNVDTVDTNTDSVLVAQQRVDTYYDERAPTREVVVIKNL